VKDRTVNRSNDEAEQLEFLLSRYLDGDLDGPTKADLERRLEADAELAAALEDLSRTDRLIQAWAGPVPRIDGERFVEEAARRRRLDHAWRRRWHRLRVFAPIAAAATIMLVVTLYSSVKPSQQDGAGRAVAVVSIHRADAWRKATGLGEAFAEVRFDRSPPPGIDAALSGPKTVVAVAVAGAGPPVAEVMAGEETPYF
jgi:anti-sigma factor RsiW